MKKLLALILAVCVLSALAACGGDDDGDSAPVSDLIGSWKSKDTEQFFGDSVMLLEFSVDYTGRETSYTQGGLWLWTLPFIWEASDGYLTMEGNNITIFKYEVEGNTLTLSFVGFDVWGVHLDGVYAFQRA